MYKFLTGRKLKKIIDHFSYFFSDYNYVSSTQPKHTAFLYNILSNFTGRRKPLIEYFFVLYIFFHNLIIDIHLI